MSELPCKTCITFAICKSLYIQRYEEPNLIPTESSKHLSARGVLYTRCGLYRVWAEKNFEPIYQKYNGSSKEIHELFYGEVNGKHK